MKWATLALAADGLIRHGECGGLAIVLSADDDERSATMDDNWTTPYTIRMRRVRDGVERDVAWQGSSDPDSVDYVLTDGHWGDPDNRALLFGDPSPEPPLDDDAREYVIVRVTREDGTVVMEGDPTVDEPPNGDPDPDAVG